MANLPHSVEELFEAALDLPANERPAFLDQACRNQPMLRRMTEELLAEDAQAGSFLAEPIFGISAPYESVVVSPGDAWQRASAGAPRFRADDVLAHRFIVVRFLARGGMGEVYEVEDLWLHGTHVALKVIRPEIAADAAHARRFEQEVLLARKVTHPNLCPIYEIFRCDDPAPPFLFLTMKLLAGETLAARLRASEALSCADRELVCCELVHAVAALHAGGIIHRDIKPGNVMLDTTVAPFRVALMDFGLARLREAEPTVFDRHSAFSSGAIVVAGNPRLSCTGAAAWRSTGRGLRPLRARRRASPGFHGQPPHIVAGRPLCPPIIRPAPVPGLQRDDSRRGGSSLHQP